MIAEFLFSHGDNMNKEQLMNFDFLRIDVVLTIFMLREALQEFNTFGLIIVTIIISVGISLIRMIYDIKIKDGFEELKYRSEMHFSKR